LPAVDENINQDVMANYQKKGLEWLQNEVQKHDLQFYECSENKNPARLIRALVFKKSVGQSILDFRIGKEKNLPFDVSTFNLYLPREILYPRINNRVEQMIENGLIPEAERLVPYKHLQALQTVGYRELFDYFEGKIERDSAIELIKKNTRNYAKRQETWFRKSEPKVNISM